MTTFQKVVATMAFGTMVGLAVSGAMQVTINNLHKATAVQCLDHQWPSDKHVAMMSWCKQNQLKTE